jgi:hypothetical protein
MTKRQAFAIDAVVGCIVTWGSVILLNALGADDGIQGAVAMLGLAGTSLMVGVITWLYDRNR